MDLVKKFEALSKRVADAEKSIASNEGKKEMLLKKLQEEFECSSIEEGLEMVNQYKDHCGGLREEIETLLNKAESLLE